MIARRAAVLLLTCAACAADAAAAPAPPAQAARQLEAAQHERERDRDLARAEAEAAHLEVDQLQAQLAELEAGQRTGERAVGERRLALAALTVRENELDARMGGNQGQLARLLGALELFRANPPPALFVDPHHVRDAVRAAILIRAITPELETRARALRAEALQLKQLRRQAAAASEALFTSESDVADRRAQIESLIAAKTAAQHQADADAAAANLDARTFAARLAGLRNGRPAPLIPPLGAPPPDPEHAGPGGRARPFKPPVARAPIERFGQTRAGESGRTQGWTWRPAAGAVVVAPAAGVVEYAEPLKGWGVVLILRLGGDYRLVLAGMDQAVVAEGQPVAEGQAVGRMPIDSKDGGLYFEIRKRGQLVDPAIWLKP